MHSTWHSTWPQGSGPVRDIPEGHWGRRSGVSTREGSETTAGAGSVTAVGDQWSEKRTGHQKHLSVFFSRNKSLLDVSKATCALEHMWPCAPWSPVSSLPA